MTQQAVQSSDVARLNFQMRPAVSNQQTSRLFNRGAHTSGSLYKRSIPGVLLEDLI